MFNIFLLHTMFNNYSLTCMGHIPRHFLFLENINFHFTNQTKLHDYSAKIIYLTKFKTNINVSTKLPSWDLQWQPDWRGQVSSWQPQYRYHTLLDDRIPSFPWKLVFDVRSHLTRRKKEIPYQLKCRNTNQINVWLVKLFLFYFLPQ